MHIIGLDVSAHSLDERDLALLELGRWLLAHDYRFVTITPESHARVLARRPEEPAETVRGVFGWSRKYTPGFLPEAAQSLLEKSGCLEREGPFFRSTVRFSTVDDAIYVHSAYPTHGADDVFFGPDTYRFIRMLRALPGRFGRVVDVGAGSGAGGLALASRCRELLLADVNPKALRFSAVNAALAGTTVSLAQSDLLTAIEGDFDLILSNPPYLADDRGRSYRDGGNEGIAIAVRIVRESLPRLRPGGTLALYTGTPVVEGRDRLHEAVAPALAEFDGSVKYEELDVDVFGEELSLVPYSHVERISVVSLIATRRSE